MSAGARPNPGSRSGARPAHGGVADGEAPRGRGRRIAVIGGGITGLSAAFELERILADECAGAAGVLGAAKGSRRSSRVEILLLEASGELGGKVRTEWQEGFLLESGPDGFLTRKTAAMELCSQLDITTTLIGRKPALQPALVRRGGALYPLPEGLSGLVPADLDALGRSPLLSVAGRERARKEPEIPPRAAAVADDESVAAFMSRRFGREAFDLMIEPLVTGIFAADADSLSLQATYPRLREIELRHGSLVRALASAGGGRSSEAGALPPFLTPRSGMGEIPRALAAALKSTRILLSSRVELLERRDPGWRILLEGGEWLDADAVIIAMPAFAASSLLDGVSAELTALLAQIPFASTAIVHLAFRSPLSASTERAIQSGSDGSPTSQSKGRGNQALRSDADFPGAVDTRAALLSSGYLIPAIEASPFLACTLTSQKWEGRAPDGTLLVRLYAGRAGRDPLPCDVLLREARAELSRTLGLGAPPVLSKVVRWDRAMPQYTLGHLDRLAEIDSALLHLATRGSPLLLAGASYRGVGVPDCIQSGREAARRAASLLGVRGTAGREEVGP